MEKKSLVKRIAVVSDIVSAPLPGQTLVELLGTERVVIENHKGICQYSGTKICIKSFYGCISVCGNNLQIAKMTKESLVISGDIHGITPERKGKG